MSAVVMAVIFYSVKISFAVKSPKTFSEAIKKGKAYFFKPYGVNGKSCATCHLLNKNTKKGKITIPAIKGIARFFPKWKNNKIYTLKDQLEHCIVYGENGFRPKKNSNIINYLYFYLYYLSNGYRIKIVPSIKMH
jgi:cytochrome c